MLFGIVVFPGSNCDHDVYHVAKHVLGCAARFIWHKDRDLRGADVVVLPGGFSYGDYLRTGAIARFSPVMDEVRKFAQRGGHVAGFCNGFQILLESGLLPGAMRRNTSLRYVCRDVHLKVENARTPWTRKYAQGEVARIPIGHGEGNYFIDDEGLRRLEGEGQIAFRYVTQAGARGDAFANPNGSLADIAGITNARGNVLGMMPHPERLAEGVLGGEDGRKLFESVIEAVERGAIGPRRLSRGRSSCRRWARSSSSSPLLRAPRPPTRESGSPARRRTSRRSAAAFSASRWSPPASSPPSSCPPRNC